MKSVVLIGASGFIGQHLLSKLSQRTDFEIRVLIHQNRPSSLPKIEYIQGDLLSPQSLDHLFKKDDVVINLAYLKNDNLAAMKNIAEACARAQVQRFIHCSTAVVVGRTSEIQVNEQTPVNPYSKYEKDKLQTENELMAVAQGKFEITILRPSAVFGPGGKNLLKLADEIEHKNRTWSYLKSCLYGHRSLNLVSVENVAAALEFLIGATKVDREIFIISDDDSAINNYSEVEKRLRLSFGKKNHPARLYLPKAILSSLMIIQGKSNTNLSLKFSDKKLFDRGFKKPQDLESALFNFANWYKNTQINPR